MSDIFISYSSSDKDKVEPLVRLLEEQGWSVWWDKRIPVGKTYDDIISEALDASKCVVVVWTKNSATSKWVRTEASEGARRDVLVPVLLEKVRVPLEFRLIQAAQLFNWNGAPTDPEITKFLDSVAAILGNQPSPPQDERVIQPSITGHHTEDSTPPSSTGQRYLFSNSMFKAGILTVAAIALAVFFWVIIKPQITSTNKNDNASTNRTDNASTKRSGTVIVYYSTQVNVPTVVKALEDRGYTVSAKPRPGQGPDNPDVRYYYQEDFDNADDVVSIINKTLGPTVKRNDDRIKEQSAVSSHSKGTIEVWLK